MVSFLQSVDQTEQVMHGDIMLRDKRMHGNAAFEGQYHAQLQTYIKTESGAGMKIMANFSLLSAIMPGAQLG